MIEAHELTKRYGDKAAVDGIRFAILRDRPPVAAALFSLGAGTLLRSSADETPEASAICRDQLRGSCASSPRDRTPSFW
jgi:hypothetical protein